MNILEINKSAKETIKGARLKFACIQAIITIVGILASKTPYIGGILNFTVSNLFLVGHYCLYSEYIKTKQVKLKNLFSRKDVVLKCMCCSFLSIIICALWTIAFIVPGIIVIFSYLMYSCIIVDREVGVFEALSLSRQMMKGHKMELFKLVLSFWVLNIMQVNFIITTLIWVGVAYETPRYTIARIMFYNKIKYSV